MKMKRIIYSLTLAAALVFATSCDEKLEELLQDPNKVGPSTVSPEFLLNGIQLDFAVDVWYGMADRGAGLTRIINQGSALYETAYGPASTNTTWTDSYADVLADIQFLEPIAEESNLQRHLGIAKTIKAMTLFILVDNYGDVPYSEALNPDNLSPKVDDDEAVYEAAFKILDEAKVHFTAETNAGAIPPNDYFYENDYEKWIRLINTLKLRYFLNIRLVDEAKAKAGIDALIAEGNLIGEGDSFIFRFGTTSANPDSRHPKFVGQYTTGGGDYQSTFFIWNLVEAKGFDDPRLRYYMYRQVLRNTKNVDLQECISQIAPPHYLVGSFVYCNIKSDRGYWGRDHLDPDGIPPDQLTRTAYGPYPAGGRFDDDSASPVNNISLGAKGAGLHPIMLAAYVDFMLAEAALTMGTAGDPKALLLSGIEKHLDFVRDFSVNAGEGTVISEFESDDQYMTDVEKYLSYIDKEYAEQPSTDKKLNVIGREYWLSLYGNGLEAFNLYRRTGKPEKMQPALEANADPFLRTFLYPNNYVVTNTNAEQKKDLSTQVFWDINPADGWIY